MKILYRLSDGSNKHKVKLEHATKQHCLLNCIQTFPDAEIFIYADNVQDTTYEWVCSLGHAVERTSSANNAASFLHVLNVAVTFDASEVVYFLEDDYLHRTGADMVLLEGLGRADYVSLYDHPDKYIAGGNRFVDGDGGEITKVYITKSSHWKLTNSTTMAFASQVQTLHVDYAIWKAACAGKIPTDFDTFIALRNTGRSLITPIPSYATHCEKQWLAPFINWTTI